MRRPAVIVLGVVVVGLIGLVLAATLRQTSQAFTLGVPTAAPVAPLNHGDSVCQGPIDVASGAAFDHVTTQVGTYGAAGSPLRVTVKDLRGNVVASGRIRGGYPDVAGQPSHDIALDHMVRTPRISVCIHNVGDTKVAIYGAPDLAARSSTASLDGKPLGVDVALSFERAPRSYAELVPRVLARAALFRFPGMGAWAYVALIVVLVVAGAGLLARAVSTAREPDASDQAQ